MGAAIESLETRVYRIPTEEPEADGTLEWDSTTVVTAHARADGREGLGYTYGHEACASLVRSELHETVVGRDAHDVQGSWAAMVRRIRNLGRPGIVSMAIAAVDIALWDLKAKLLDLPLVTLLGRVREAVPVYGSGGFTSLTDEQLRAQLEHWAHELGIPRVKMKVAEGWGQDERRDRDRVAIARSAIGPDIGLFVDANGGYARKQAVRQAHAFAAHDVVWFEEPVSSDDLHGLRVVRDAVGCDVAAGEYGYGIDYFERMISAGAIDVVQADVSRCAGITEWTRVAAVAASHGLEISGHTAPFLHLHVACAVPNVRHIEYFHDHVRIAHLLFDDPPVPVGGELRPHLDRPGHGVRIVDDRADAYRRS